MLTPTPYLAVITTTGSRLQAQQIARSLVDRHLIACAQISEIESFYPWDGKTHQEPEFRLVCKTLRDNYAIVEAAIREIHSYELPGIYAVAVEAIYEPYGAWIRDNSQRN